MLISFYSNKSLIYLFIYAIFKFIFYLSLTNFFSSFLPSLYIISISKIFTFTIYKIKYKIQSLQNNEDIFIRIENQEQLINRQLNNNNNNIILNLNERERNSHERRKKILSWVLVFVISILELIFYALFNKIDDNDSNKRGDYYLMNNKFFFLLILGILYFWIFKKYNYKHNIVAIIILAISQIGIYFFNYISYFHNTFFLIYSFFMNSIYSLQNFFERTLIMIKDSHEKRTMYITTEEGIIELIIAVILTIAFKLYFGTVPTTPFLYDYTLTVKFIFMALCIVLTEYIRLDTLKEYNPFYICLYEEIIYISFWIYNSPEKEISYIIFHILNLFAIFVFIEVIELNFCGLNQRTERFLRERERDFNHFFRNDNNSSLSTGSNSGGNNEQNNIQNHEIILNDDFQDFNIFDDNEINDIILNNDNKNDENIIEENKDNNIINDSKDDIKIDKILIDED